MVLCMCCVWHVSLITILYLILKDIPSSRVEDETVSEAGSSPRLVCFVDSNYDLEEAVIVADTARLFTHTTDIYESVVLLMGAYYVADVAYPKVYANILSIIQQFVIGEAFTDKRSANCIKFLTKHQSLFN